MYYQWLQNKDVINIILKFRVLQEVLRLFLVLSSHTYQTEIEIAVLTTVISKEIYHS